MFASIQRTTSEASASDFDMKEAMKAYTQLVVKLRQLSQKHLYE
jgi:hypothetical protein